MIKDEISLEEMKQIELDILLKIDSFCKENQLRYAIGYGTLIGAVRHHGFIPWDDDIDIMMPRPDYEKFINSFQDSIYKLLCIEHGDYYRTYAKVYDSRTLITNTNNKDMGIFVDVIPIDGLPAKEDEARSYLRKMVRIRKWMYKIMAYNIYGRKKPVLKSSVFRLIGVLYPIPNIIRLYLSLSKKYDFENSNYVAGFAVGPDTWLLKREFVDKFTDLEFEGKLFKAPLYYDQCLRVLYGDYMQLPPVEERTPKHAYQVYWK